MKYSKGPYIVSLPSRDAEVQAVIGPEVTIGPFDGEKKAQDWALAHYHNVEGFHIQPMITPKKANKWIKKDQSWPWRRITK